MIVRFKEIYEVKGGSTHPGMTAYKKKFQTRDVFVNPSHVVCIREDHAYGGMLTEADCSAEIDAAASYTRVYMNRGQSGIDLVVEGTPSQVEKTLQMGKELLYG